MARRKNSTALFEVISAGRVSAASGNSSGRPSAFNTPAGQSNWWSKGRRLLAGRPAESVSSAPAAAPATSAAVAPALDAADPTAGMTAASLAARSAPTARPVSVASSTPVVGDFVVPDAAPDTEIPPGVPFLSADVLPAHEPAVSFTATVPTYARPSASSSFGAARSGMRMAFDGDRNELTLKMRYTTALITAFSILVIVGLSYVFGRGMSSGPAPARAADQTTQKKKTSRSNVMDVAARGAKPSTGSRAASMSPVGAVAANHGNGGAVAGSLQPSRLAPAPTTYDDAAVSADGSSARRVIGMNYMVIQSYPAEMLKTAMEVREFLTKSGIPCTVEVGSPKTHTNTGWYIVVGTRGFAPGFGRSPDYEAYNKAIESAAKSFPTKSKFDRPQPMTVKWAE